jgi:hypothetical protein
LISSAKGLLQQYQIIVDVTRGFDPKNLGVAAAMRAPNFI